MIQVARFFNTAGPIQRNMHYHIDPLKRIELEEVEMLMAQRKYFVLHAPRQTGKTSCLLALRDYLNEQGQYHALYVNVEAGQAKREDSDAVIKGILSTIRGEIRTLFKGQNIIDIDSIYNSMFSQDNFAEALTEMLRLICEALDKPLVLFIDEIDALVGDSLISVLRQIRAGYANRPSSFPQSIILCGVRDVRDYRSAFNIKAASLRLGNLSKEEVRELFLQHTLATGQEFDEECFPMIWSATEGQPWLVNALGYEVTMKMRENRDRSVRIIPDMIYKAQERIIYRRETHIDSLIDKLKEDRVRRVIGPMLANAEAHFIVFNRDKGVEWDDKIFHRYEEYKGVKIGIWGM